MSYAMRLLLWANGKPLHCAGEFVKSVHVQEAPNTIEWLTTTPNIKEARTWETPRDALETYEEVLISNPVRPDGKPNKPLTALTVELVKIKGD